MPYFQTARLELIPATAAHLRADLDGREALARALAIEVPAAWPPDLYDEDAIRYALRWLGDRPTESDWGFYYIARRAAHGQPRLLIGAGGFKGGPDEEGTVEVGYSILAQHQRQGYATEAVLEWTRFAFGTPEVSRVIGQTLPSLAASIRVLEKAGFHAAGEGYDPNAPEGETVLRYELSRPVVRSVRL